VLCPERRSGWIPMHTSCPAQGGALFSDSQGLNLVVLESPATFGLRTSGPLPVVSLCARIGVFVFSLSLRLAHRCILRYPPPTPCRMFRLSTCGFGPCAGRFSCALEQCMSRRPSGRGHCVYAISFPCGPRSGARLSRIRTTVP